MVKRLFAIAFIFACTAIGWMALGATIFERSRSADAGLRGRVSSTWGAPQEQRAPSAFIERIETRVVRDQAGDAARAAAERTEAVRVRVEQPLVQTRASVAFDLEHRQKGLMWYATYAVAFDGSFAFRNDSRADSVHFEFRLPVKAAVYDDLRVTLNGTPVRYEMRDQAIAFTARVPRGDTATLGVAYRSQGLDQWRYVLGSESEVAEVRDFELRMRTNFEAIDFPDNTLSPAERREDGDGWDLLAKQGTYAELFSLQAAGYK